MDEKRCCYSYDYRRCPAIARHFICNTVLYRHCGYFHKLDKQDRFRQQHLKTVETLLQEDKELKERLK